MRTSAKPASQRPRLSRRATCLTIGLLAPLLLILVGGCGSGSATISHGSTSTPVVGTSGLFISPVQVTLLSGATQNFSATVNNTSDQSVTWSVQEGTTGGAISTTGVYTAPSAPGTYHTVAASVADSTKTASATIIVRAAPTPSASVSVSLSPLGVTLSIGESEAFTGTVTNSTDASLTYSVQEGASGGTITAAGVYTAPATAGTYHVIATSVADTTKTDSATVIVLPTVTVTPAAATIPINGTTTFSAAVNGVSNQGVTYSVSEGSTGGTITSAGTYTAPNIAGTYHILAKSSANSSIFGTATVTVQAGSSVLNVH